jgi:DNA-binding response OmpR family regulator
VAKILIVDDNEDLLHLLQFIFTSRDHIVHTTTRGEETFNLINTFQPALICLDINLSGMDGRDICRKIKTTEETKHLPVILISANIIKQTTIDESLADEFAAKPFDIHELLVKVTKLIASAEDNAESMSA